YQRRRQIDGPMSRQITWPQSEQVATWPRIQTERWNRKGQIPDGFSGKTWRKPPPELCETGLARARLAQAGLPNDGIAMNEGQTIHQSSHFCRSQSTAHPDFRDDFCIHSPW